MTPAFRFRGRRRRKYYLVREGASDQPRGPRPRTTRAGPYGRCGPGAWAAGPARGLLSDREGQQHRGGPAVQRVGGAAEPVGVFDREREGQAADGGAGGDRDGRADRADRVLLEVEHGHGGRLGVETGQQQPLAGDGPRGEPGHLVPGEVVAAAVVVELAEQALADRAGGGGGAEV